MDTVDERFESGVYRNFHFNVTYFQQCLYDVLGSGAEAYYRLAYDAIFGPPSSQTAIGKFGNLVLVAISVYCFFNFIYLFILCIGFYNAFSGSIFFSSDQPGKVFLTRQVGDVFFITQGLFSSKQLVFPPPLPTNPKYQNGAPLIII